jgi:cytochrome c553
MKLLITTLMILLLAVILAACSGASAATIAPTSSPTVPPTAPPIASPTIPPTFTPTAAAPTPDITVYLEMDVSGGDAEKGITAATIYSCKSCHDGTVAEKAPRFTAMDDMPYILERGEMRIADTAYNGQATTNQEYILESIFNPQAYTAPGEWAATMPDNFASRIDEEDLANLLAWLESFE